MNKSILVIVASLLLTGCFSKSEEEQFQWAVDFCGGKDQIADFQIYSAIPSRVYCVDRRWASIPD